MLPRLACCKCAAVNLKVRVSFRIRISVSEANTSVLCTGSLVVACRLSSCGLWGLSSPTRDGTHAPCIRSPSLNHWIIREVPAYGILFEQPELRQGPLACGEVSCSQRHSQCAELGTTVLTMDACVLSGFRRVQLCDPMGRRPPGSSVHEDSPGKNTGVCC